MHVVAAVVDGDVDALVESLAALPAAVVPLAGLGDEWGLPEAELAAIVAAAVAAARVELWNDAPGGPAIILSTTEAAALGLELAVEPGPAYSDAWLARSLRWIPRGSAPAETIECFHELAKVCETDLIDPMTGEGGFDDLVDHRARDLDETRAACRCGGSCLHDATTETKPGRRRELQAVGLALWEPAHMLGLGVSWPVAPDADGACGVCHEATLGESTLCLWCNRSGVDHLLPEVPAAERPKKVPSPYRNDGLVGGRGEAEPAERTPSAEPEIPGGWQLKPRAGPRPRRSIHAKPA
jgi:hypothetical protein